MNTPVSLSVLSRIHASPEGLSCACNGVFFSAFPASIKEGMEYALLTDTISRGTFRLTTKDHRTVKGLKKSHNLRDHMSPLELALTMLGETTTAELARTTDARAYRSNEEAAVLGGKVAGGARKNIEQRIGHSVISRDNHLPKKQPKFAPQPPRKK